MKRWLATALAATTALAGCSAPVQTAAAGYVYSTTGAVTEWPAGQGPQVPTLVGTDTAANPVSSAAGAGRVLVVNFWYAACPPCRAEAPILAAAAAAYPAVAFLGVNSTDSAATAAAFERTFTTGYPTIIDTDGAVTASLQTVVPLAAFPTTLIVGTDGRVRARIIGELDESTLRTLLKTAGHE